MLTIPQADAILECAFTPQLAQAGFAFAGKRTWARTEKPHLCELVRMCHTKGAGVTPIWGLALDFVPQISGSSLKWKRLPKDLYFDLEWHPLDYDEAYRTKAEASHKKNYLARSDAANKLTESAGRTDDSIVDTIHFSSRLRMVKPGTTTGGEKWYVNLFDPLEAFKAGSASLARLTASEAVQFLDQIKSSEDVAKLLAFQRSYPYQGLGFFNHVQPPLAYAFLLARLGQADGAKNSYAEYCEHLPVNDEVRKKLDQAFAVALSAPFSPP